MGREGETKEERKERKRLKKLAKEAKKAKKVAKKRKLEEMEEDSDEKIESPKSKKRKLSSDSDDDDTAKVDFTDITKVIVTASKEQLQNALLQCAKQTPSNIPVMETNLEATELDSDLQTLLETERDTAAANAPADTAMNGHHDTSMNGNPFGAATGDAVEAVASAGKLTGTVMKWNHEKGFGFIQRDDGKGDLFCHRRDCYVTEPHQNAKVGSKVEFLIEKDAEKGDRATEVSAVGGGTLEGGRQCTGTCVSWLADREFGFVRSDADGSQHIAFNRECYTVDYVLYPQMRVEFDLKYKDDGRTQAVAICPEGAGPNAYKACPFCEGFGHTPKDCPVLKAELAGGDGDGGGDGDAATAPKEEEWVDKDPTPGKTTGVVMQWKHERGFGFIKGDDGKEYFCHVREVWVDPPARNARVGDKVEFDVAMGEKGEAASNVQRLGGGAVRGGRQMKGWVVKWLDDRGFGFILGDDGNEYFAPDRDVWEADGYLVQKARVQFDVKTKDDGRTQAIYITNDGTDVMQCMSCEGFGHMAQNCPGFGNEAGAEGGAEAAGAEGGAEAGAEAAY